MCILCVIQKWSRRVATMLPWLVIPLIGLWLLSQLLPPAFRFEITSPRLACVFVLLVTLFWYEILMPQLSAWRVRRNARLRERKRFEAIELQKLKKTATRRCRNCLTPYRDQNPGGGRFMCSYCGHISKRPVLDLPVPPGLGLSNSGILKDLVGKGGKLLNGKAWSDNGWMCGQDWLENGNWVGGAFAGKPSYWRNGGGSFGGDDHCLAERSYSHVLIFACKSFTTFFFSIMGLWRKIFRVSSSRGDASLDVDRRGALDKRGENVGNCHESRGEKARRKAEEKRQARLEKELLEEEERKQREEVARLVEERRRLRDEKMEAEKERGKGSPLKGRDRRKEAEKKRHERKKERDHGSSKSNSDVEELEKRASRECERYKKCDSDRRENHRSGSESAKAHGAEVGHPFKSTSVNSHSKGVAGTRYLDRVRGTFLSSSRAFTGGGFFGKSSANTVAREPKANAFADQSQTNSNRREVSQLDRVYSKSSGNGDEKNISRPALIDPQPGGLAPKKSWQQLFTRSSSASQPSSSNVISRPNGKSKPEVQSPFTCNPPTTQAFDNPINFGLPSPFSASSFPFGSTNSNTNFLLPSEPMFPQIGEAPHQFLPEESEIFEDPCYVPDPVSLLGPVSESLDNFQLDRGFVADSGLETPSTMKNISVSAEVNRPSPIESPISRLRVSEERHANPFSFPSTAKAQDLHHLPVGGSINANDTGTWQMWNSSPLGQDGLGLVGGPASWLLPPELNRAKNEDILHPTPQKTMASLFKNDDQVHSGIHSPQNVIFGSLHNGRTVNSSVSGGPDGSWLPKTFIGPIPGNEDQFSRKFREEAAQNNMIYGSAGCSATNHQNEVSGANCWAKKDRNMPVSGIGVGNSSGTKPHIGGLYSAPDVQSFWSYDCEKE
ncbi:uncharacterized protein LOC113774845 [Coffea eugenioides]|uniref:uncharacterized protein LOC113774845 n=1 Tax=Coffea eugenioides TaxID=49369 RepID=UPI000F60FD59|nr:uncharacterized protein LOC113774845 [Coffea eugenioides]XP_027175283.1 uncharacterized protein LOC113774845 [Coffea eugenioides]